jgi:dihydrodipicolinate synthase/N-acetylneuraminate lyase
MNNKKLSKENMRGVWSAAPTPFTETMELDSASIKRMIEHHVKLEVKGLFLCGTAGEGYMLTTTMRQRLLAEVAEQTDGRLILTTQVTDNSTPRVLEKIEEAAKYGMDVAIVSTPNFMPNNTPENLLTLFTEIVRNSPLPIGIYDRGSFGSVAITTEVLSEIAKDDNIVMLKDSSSSDDHMRALLKAREANSNITLLNGNEFNCVHYIKNGYDGLLLGGGVFNAKMARKIMDLTLTGNIEEANSLQERMSEMMHNIFGGKNNECWLTGQKQLLVELGVFSTNKNYYNYPLTASCAAKIKEELEREKEFLL